MGLAEVHGFSHMFCSKLDIGLGPEITFVLYYETRLGGGASGEGKKPGCGRQSSGNKGTSTGVRLTPLKARPRTAGGWGKRGDSQVFRAFIPAVRWRNWNSGEWMGHFSGHPLIGPGAHLWDHIVAWVWEFIAVGQYALGLHPGIMRKVRAVWHYLFSMLRMLAVLYSPSSFSKLTYFSLFLLIILFNDNWWF